MAVLKSLLGCLSLVSLSHGLGLDLSSVDEDSLGATGVDGRLLLLNSAGLGGLNLNVTILAALLASLASALLSLFTLTGIGLLAASKMNDDKSDHGGGYSSYGSSYRRMDPFQLDWETVSLVDWLSLLQETWQNFNPTDIECQKRFICDIHQSKKELGPMADTLTYYFSYLEYGEILSLPEAVKMLLEEYVDAADRGRTLKRSCGDIYSECDFSIKNMLSKFGSKSSGSEKEQHPEEPGAKSHESNASTVEKNRKNYQFQKKTRSRNAENATLTSSLPKKDDILGKMNEYGGHEVTEAVHALPAQYAQSSQLNSLADNKFNYLNPHQNVRHRVNGNNPNVHNSRNKFHQATQQNNYNSYYTRNKVTHQSPFFYNSNHI